LSSLTSTINSAVNETNFFVSSSASFRNSFSYSPSFLFTSIAGILIPWPVPSSDKIKSAISSFLLSTMMARAPPLLSIFLTYCTNEHVPTSTITNGERTLSGSPDQSSVNGKSGMQPSGFVLL